MTRVLAIPAGADLRRAAAFAGWLGALLLLDADGSLARQRTMGVLTWVVLAVALRRELPLVRAQVAVVVAFASVVEYTFSPLLHVYVYRFANVPLYVPPGHGLVYLAALAIARSALRGRYRRGAAALTVAVGGAWAIWGLVGAARPDALGAFWFACLAGFLFWGRSPGLYVGAFVVVSALELTGTALGTWQWQPRDPTGLVSIGNPPSGAAGGYGWFDLVAALVAPRLLAAGRSLRDARLSPLPRRTAAPVDHGESGLSSAC